MNQNKRLDDDYGWVKPEDREMLLNEEAFTEFRETVDNNTIKITKKADYNKFDEGENFEPHGDKNCTDVLGVVELEGTIGPFTFPAGSKVSINIAKRGLDVLNDTHQLFNNVADQAPEEFWWSDEYDYLVKVLEIAICDGGNIDDLLWEQQQLDDACPRCGKVMEMDYETYYGDTKCSVECEEEKNNKRDKDRSDGHALFLLQ